MWSTQQVLSQVTNFSLKMSAALLLLLLAAAAHRSSNLDYSCSDSEKHCILQNFVLETDEDLNAVRFPTFSHPLIIESGKITHFSRQLAEKLTDVEDLTVNGFELETFYVKPEMTRLEATKNRIHKLLVDDEDLSRTYNIQSLNLTGNELTDVAVLERFTQLRYLHLDGNKLKQLSMDLFSGMTELRELSIADNELVELDTKESLQLVKLKTLSLAGNKLVELNVQIWELESLKRLDLSRNELHQLIGGFDRLGSLQSAKLAGNLWECDSLLGLNSLELTELDADEEGRCEKESMIDFREICCTLDAVSSLGESNGKELELFNNKWEEIQRLQDTVKQLSALIGEVKRSDSETKTTERTVEERMQELEDHLEKVRSKLNEQDESAIAEKIEELKQITSEHETTVESLQSKQSEYESRLDSLENQLSSLQQAMDEKFEAVDTIKERVEKLEQQLSVEGTEPVQQSVTELKEAVKRLDNQQNKYQLFSLSLKSQIGKERSKIVSVQELYQKLMKDVKALQDKVDKEESKMSRASQMVMW